MNSLYAVIAAWLNVVSLRSNVIANEATSQMAADKEGRWLIESPHVRTYVYPALTR